jgi:endogenous inhibitor of DNA gyrase (YacG/DUF329 family)
VTAKTSDDAEAVVPQRPCPICGKPSVRATRPFCSSRCADIDLHRWLGGVYIVGGDDGSSEPDENREHEE